ncbi:amidase [Agrilactobacillus fermenti]|uniref:amidase n=1 Tax=Agrilactobacillus fermenti TaxID=2586909 RepID=UPI001E51B800|nr:amidase [Agrilactobacillus fermenti]MCD2255430.1 amidase [Agrilactobacillus fermenti]
MLSALMTAQLIRQNKISLTELLADTEAKIKSLNPQLNAVTYTRFAAARQEAMHLSDTGQPFFGVPLLLKGLGQNLKGTPNTMGSKLLAHQIAAQTDHFVRRLQALGFIIVGQTNTPEFGFKNITDPRLYGPSHNPWQLGHTPGGSSGGAASALASGMVPLVTGSDGGGSIRIPAAFSGLIGLKPTRGRVPVGPGEYRSWQGAAINFALTTNIADTAALLQGLQTLQAAAPFQTPLIPTAAFQNLTSTHTIKTIAYTTESPVGTPVSAVAQTAVMQAVTFLRQQGFRVVEAQPELDGQALMRSYFTMNAGETAAMIAALEKQHQRAVIANDIEPISWAIYQAGRHTTAAEYSSALNLWDQASQVMADFMSNYDLYLTPTTAWPAPEIKTPLQSPLLQTQIAHVQDLAPQEQKNLIYDLFYESLVYSPFTQLANLTGQPAISLPTALDDKASLPLGIQFMARKGAEIELLQIGRLFESQNQFHLLHPLNMSL